MKGTGPKIPKQKGRYTLGSLIGRLNITEMFIFSQLMQIQLMQILSNFQQNLSWNKTQSKDHIEENNVNGQENYIKQ